MSAGLEGFPRWAGRHACLTPWMGHPRTTWQALWAANKDVVSDPNWISVGWQLRLTGSAPAATPAPAAPAPAATAGGSYTVVAGDTLYKIAAKKGVTGGWQTLYDANKGAVSDPSVIYPGQVLSLG